MSTRQFHDYFEALVLNDLNVFPIRIGSRFPNNRSICEYWSDYGFVNRQFISVVENRSSTNDRVQSGNRSVCLIPE